jgi:ADP-ribosyl-[dinitrogen reductase] hydrolase
MINDRRKGCMYGLAIGDALGAAVEFRPPGTFALVEKYRGFGPFDLEPGQWTDDTSLALALADSIKNGWDLKDQLTKYANWYENGDYSVNGRCFDIGGTTRQGICSFLENDTVVAPYDTYSLGNGSIMRLAPVPIKYYDDPKLDDYAAESSATTHSMPECRDACVFLANLLANLIKGEDREVAIKQAANHVRVDKILEAVTFGYLIFTTGAIAGQMAGAYWGYSNIPQELIDGLDKKEMIDKYLDPLLDAINGN